MDTCNKRSNEANQIIQFMLIHLSHMRYGPMNIIHGCFDTAIENYGYSNPNESKDSICSFVKDILNSIDNDIKL